jgi:hypothetical protein
LSHRRKSTIDANDGVAAHGTHLIRIRVKQVCGGRIQIDVGAAMIEMHSHVWIALRGLDHRGVERGASDLVDVFVRVAVVGGKMQVTGFAVNHSTAHRNRVPQYLVSNPELLERVNPTRGEREIDRPPSDDISFARISSPLVKIDLVSAPPEVRREQPSGKAAAD